MHLGWACEGLVRKLAKRCRVREPGKNWYVRSGQLRKHCDALPAQRQRERRVLLSTVCGALDTARLVWRNDAAHPGKMTSANETVRFFQQVEIATEAGEQFLRMRSYAVIVRPNLLAVVTVDVTV